ncbi:hypothetical protein EDB89DRAFT_1979628 [Lactarius sanguifluus]|nr:hypothetical protein EDB89DRAFT_1979628 [Lactarius sanguifluus]
MRAPVYFASLGHLALFLALCRLCGCCCRRGMGAHGDGSGSSAQGYRARQDRVFRERSCLSTAGPWNRSPLGSAQICNTSGRPCPGNRPENVTAFQVVSWRRTLGKTPGSLNHGM